HAACGHQPSGRRRAGADPDGRWRYRRPVRRTRGAENPRRTFAAAAGPPGSRRRHPFCRRTCDPARGSLYRARNGGHRMIPRLSLSLAGLALAAALAISPAQAERLIVSVSNHRVTVTPNYSGEELVLFGSVEKDATTPANRNYDLVVTVGGPRADMVTRRKERKFGIWINTDSRQFLKVPSYLAL